MAYLFDTNVLSEVFRRRPNPELVPATSHAYRTHLTISRRVGFLPYIRMPTR